MAKWEFKEKREDDRVCIGLLRDSRQAGYIEGKIHVSPSGTKYFLVCGFGVHGAVQREYMEPLQREYMKEHKGVKMGEALGLEFLKLLEREGISHISLGALSSRGARFIERSISTGIIEKTPGPEGYSRINWDKVPASKEAMKKMIGQIRARETIPARAVRRLRSIFRRTRPK